MSLISHIITSSPLETSSPFMCLAREVYLFPLNEYEIVPKPSLYILDITSALSPIKSAFVGALVF